MTLPRGRSLSEGGSVRSATKIWHLATWVGCVVVVAAASIMNAVYGLVMALVMLTIALVFSRLVPVEKLVFLVLASKPLVDLTWRWTVMETSEQEVNAQTILAVFTIFMACIVVAKHPRAIPGSGLLIVLALCASLSVLFTPSTWGLNELIRLCAGVSFYFTAGLVISDEQKFDRLVRYFLAAVSVPVSLSFLQLAGYLPFEAWDWGEAGAIGRVSGTYRHPLALVYFLIYAVPLALYLLSKSSRRRTTRMALGAFVGAALVALAYTYHRVAIVTIVLEVMLWYALKKQYRRVGQVIVVSLILGLLMRVNLEALYGNVADILQGEINLSSEQFLRGRGINWSLFLGALFDSHPLTWILGRGGSVAEGYVTDFGYWSSNEPHNDFIRILHAYGLAGLALHCSVLLSFAKWARGLRTCGQEFGRDLGNLMLVFLFGMVSLSVTAEPTRYPSAAWYLFAFGSVVALKVAQRSGQDPRVEYDREQVKGFAVYEGQSFVRP